MTSRVYTVKTSPSALSVSDGTSTRVFSALTHPKFTRLLGVTVVGCNIQEGEIILNGLDENGNEISETINEDSPETRLLKAAKRAAGEP